MNITTYLLCTQNLAKKETQLDTRKKEPDKVLPAQNAQVT